jgi:hypothetical protein
MYKKFESLSLRETVNNEKNFILQNWINCLVLLNTTYKIIQKVFMVRFKYLCIIFGILLVIGLSVFALKLSDNTNDASIQGVYVIFYGGKSLLWNLC